ncbi:MAG: 3-mercaptopyruvate sulfurtransferase [Candidatus Puniceispirillaceae bacterium]
MMQTTIISAEWLLSQDSDRITILDASYFLPTMGRDGRAEFVQEHIIGAQFFDIDTIKDEADPLPHMMPSASVFEAAMRDIGVHSDQQIIVYDNSPFLSSARAWWMLRYFGHLAVCVLNGGMEAWKQAGGKTEQGNPPAETGSFTAGPPEKAGLILFDELRKAVENGSAQQIIDARAADRFNGLAPEPRAGLRAGHIPGSLTMPINSLLDKQTGKLKTEQELQKLFDDAGFDMNLPSVTTCGSGVTAAGLTLALAILGKTDIRLFDGSWSQWGASDAPIK